MSSWEPLETAELLDSRKLLLEGRDVLVLEPLDEVGRAGLVETVIHPRAEMFVADGVVSPE